MRNTPANVLWLAIFVLSVTCLTSVSKLLAVTVEDLRCEYRTEPLGIDNTQPRLSWKLVDPDHVRGQRQSAFHVLVASSLDRLGQDDGDLWDSGWQADAQSVNVVYHGESLTSNQICFWKVRAKDANGVPSQWSQPARFSTGLLHSNDWKGDWIFKADQEKTDHNWYRRNFILADVPKSGIIHVASFGYHELYVNGEKISDGVMNPCLSYMKKRIPYLTYDVTDKLIQGDNVVAIWHAAGWTRWTRIREFRKPPFIFKAQLEVQSSSGRMTLASDADWKCKKSHSEYAGDWDILKFGGERIDSRRLEPDWCMPGYDDNDWPAASVWTEKVSATLSAQRVEPQVRYQTFEPISVSKDNEGRYVIDMGRNYTGQFEIALRGGSAGDVVTFEISDQMELVCNWEQKSEFIFDDSGEGVFANRFNIAGGRWITVTGLNSAPELKDIKGYVITSDRKRISQFECSNVLLNQIYEANLDTYIANTLDGILMDCPHRERRGWGEVTVAAMYGDAFPNFESGAYIDQYLQYQRDAQFPDGQIRAVINEEDRPFFMWKANNPLTVWEAYRHLGDKRILEDNYESMQKWMDWLLEHSQYQDGGALVIGERGKRKFPGLGDWCTPRGKFWDSSNSPEAAHFNNCLYAYILDIAAKIATELDKKDDAEVFARRLKVQRQATHRNSYHPKSGDYIGGQQVPQAFALLTGVTPETEKSKVYQNLVDELLYAFPYYDTGSSGQALYTRYFIESGERMDLIYELLTDTNHPSYGYFLKTGANVWPERWSAVGNSRIHTCYTGIGGYFVMGFGGIRPDPETPGMQSFVIKPAVVGGLTFANTELESMYGSTVVEWSREDNCAEFHIEVPVNTTAKVYLPAVDRQQVRESDSLAEESDGVMYVGTESSDAVGNYVIYHVESGVYDFTVDTLPKVEFPEPLYQGDNLSMIGRMNASSMYVQSEKDPNFEAFRINDGDDDTSWKADEKNDQWIEVEWLKPQRFDGVTIHEVGDNITQYEVQYWNGEAWTVCASGKTCGPSKSHDFDPVQASKCRLQIIKAGNAPTIAEFQIHRARNFE